MLPLAPFLPAPGPKPLPAARQSLLVPAMVGTRRVRSKGALQGGRRGFGAAHLELLPQLRGVALRFYPHHLLVGGLELAGGDAGLPAQAGFQDGVVNEDVLLLSGGGKGRGLSLRNLLVTAVPRVPGCSRHPLTSVCIMLILREHRVFTQL